MARNEHTWTIQCSGYKSVLKGEENEKFSTVSLELKTVIYRTLLSSQYVHILRAEHKEESTYSIQQ
jgi:hypothetical protein